MSALEELTTISSTISNPVLEKWKEDGKKVVGSFCSYVPEEILYAAGALPYRIMPAGCTETTSADVYLSHINCTYVRSCFEYALEGKYKFLDGIVFSNSCDHMRRLYDVWREKGPYDYRLLEFVEIPHKVTDAAIDFYKEEVTRFKQSVEKSLGVDIGEDSIKNAIKVYNETRGLLRKLYELRQSVSPPISGTDCLKVVLAATRIPKDQYNQLLRTLLKELIEKEGISNYRARLMIVGSEYDDPSHTRIIEELGGLVVADTLCTGGRYFWEPVENGNDLLLGLARSYMNSPQCPRMVNTLPKRLSFAVEMAQKFKVDGVIAQRIRYCDLWGAEGFNLKHNLAEADIPLLSLEREYALGGVGQLRTRIQAFLEMIEG